MNELVLCEFCGCEFDSLDLFKEHWKDNHLISYGWLLCHPAIFYYSDEELVRERVNQWKTKNHVPIEHGWCTRCDEPFRWNERSQSLYCKCSELGENNE